MPSRYWLNSSVGQLIVHAMDLPGFSTLCILGKRLKIAPLGLS